MIVCEEHGIENVRCWEYVNGWPIDCYVSSTNTYYQYDGEYWHGHDRPLEEILKFSKPRDIVIYRKMLTDIRQNERFVERGMKLVRVIGLRGLEALVNDGY